MWLVHCLQFIFVFVYIIHKSVLYTVKKHHENYFYELKNGAVKCM